MPTETDENVLLRELLTDDQQQKKDIQNVAWYVKDDLFYRSPFIFDKALEIGGILHKDYRDNCRSVIAEGRLMTFSDVVAFKYMDALWKSLNNKKYKTWLAVKRSNAYQAMQIRFEGKTFQLMTFYFL